MTDPINPAPSDEPKGDESFTWNDETPEPPGRAGTAGATATSIIESVRDVVDDIAERAGPSVRELSARAAELTATAADRAAPLAKRAGEVTADASGKLASMSRTWAADLRASMAAEKHGEPDPASTTDGSSSQVQSEPGSEPETPREPS